MQTITLSNKTLILLQQAAAKRGIETNAYAEELLQISLAVLKGNSEGEFLKTHQATEFSAIAPSGRSASEIDAEIQASRDEWDSESSHSQTGGSLLG